MDFISVNCGFYFRKLWMGACLNPSQWKNTGEDLCSQLVHHIYHITKTLKPPWLAETKTFE